MGVSLEHSPASSRFRRFLQWWRDFEAVMDLTPTDLLAARVSALELRLKRLEGLRESDEADSSAKLETDETKLGMTNRH